MGLSFGEMALLRVQDIIDLGHAHSYDSESKKEDKPKVRDATQEDIDKWLGGR